MSSWLYQIKEDSLSQNRYRYEVWEGKIITNWWDIEDVKQWPNNVEYGEIIIVFFASKKSVDPGIYGWGCISSFNQGVLNFIPVIPSDYLKMDPLWDNEIDELIDKIRLKTPQSIMYEISNDELNKVRKKLREKVCY